MTELEKQIEQKEADIRRINEEISGLKAEIDRLLASREEAAIKLAELEFKAGAVKIAINKIVRHLQTEEIHITITTWNEEKKSEESVVKILTPSKDDDGDSLFRKLNLLADNAMLIPYHLKEGGIVGPGKIIFNGLTYDI
ncbi:MAG: hypothetical protein WCX97_03910 [Candidatus Magasanikbacteria bacterium]